MKTVRKRYEDLLWEDVSVPGRTAEELYRAMTTDDGRTWYWRDVDFSDPRRAHWPGISHCHRLRTVLLGFGRARLAEEAYAARMLGALVYWLEKDPKNPNWWYNEIGVPQEVGNLLLLLGDVVDEATVALAAPILERGSMETNPAIARDWTGANFTWGAFNTLRHALLTGKTALLRQASERMAAEITLGGIEGIREDGSFFQHGPRLYSGGYGLAFCEGTARMAYLLQGTPFAFPREKVELLLLFLLDGLRHMTHRGALDWACVGREISRVNTLRGLSVPVVTELLSRIEDVPRREELMAFRALLRGDGEMTDTKYFPVAAMLCHHFNGLYVGAKFLDHRTYGAEICNREGELCFNMSYGTHTCVMRRGDEYLNINPVWDYARVPGTTARPETDEELLAHRDWSCRPLPDTHSGGGQKGRRAAIFEKAEHDSLSALVTDFAFEDGFVCLGADIRDGLARAEGVVTTVDQCFLRGDVTAEGDSVIHNGIRYTPLAHTRLQTEQGVATGSWQRNSGDLPDTPVSAELLTVTIPHGGEGPHRYAYMISAAHLPAPAVQILRNDESVQAIRLPDGSVMAVFHQDCTLEAEGISHRGEAGELLL